MPTLPSFASLRRSSALVMAGLTILCSGAKAAGDDATKRAALYLTEARKIFKHDHWSIVREGPDGFTAVHAAASGGATSGSSLDDPAPPLLVHVSITFAPKSASSTECAVKIEGFRYLARVGKKPQISGPFKADYPENSTYITKVLTEAEDRLAEKYPRYQAK